jgi:hypothetical protein
LSLLSFCNHACENATTGEFAEIYPWTQEFWREWNPVATRYWAELNHAVVFLQDVKKGEPITDDYTRWDSFFANRQKKKFGHAGVSEWCDIDFGS